MTTIGSGLCVVPHLREPDRPRAALGGLLVCAGHREHLARMLEPGDQVLADGSRIPGTLAVAYGALAAQLTPSRGRGGPGGRPTEAPLPIDPSVAEVRANIRGVLASWARLHAEELTRPSPTCRGCAMAAAIGAPACERHRPVPTDDAPAVTAAWLAQWLDWSCAQPFIDEYLAELVELDGRAASLVDRGRMRLTLYIGRCVEDGAGARCVGTVYALIRETAAGATDRVVYCDTCLTEYPSWQWSRLNGRMAAAAARRPPGPLHDGWTPAPGTRRPAVLAGLLPPPPTSGPNDAQR